MHLQEMNEVKYRFYLYRQKHSKYSNLMCSEILDLK